MRTKTTARMVRTRTTARKTTEKKKKIRKPIYSISMKKKHKSTNSENLNQEKLKKNRKFKPGAMKQFQETIKEIPKKLLRKSQKNDYDGLALFKMFQKQISKK